MMPHVEQGEAQMQDLNLEFAKLDQLIDFNQG